MNKTVKGIKKKRKETGRFNTNNWTTDPLTLSERVVPLAKNRFTVLFRSPKYQGHWLSKQKGRGTNPGEETICISLSLSDYLPTYLSVCLSMERWGESVTYFKELGHYGESKIWWGKAGRLETHGSIAAQVQTVSSLVEFLLAGGRSVFVLVRPSSDWMRPTYIWKVISSKQHLHQKPLK